MRHASGSAGDPQLRLRVPPRSGSPPTSHRGTCPRPGRASTFAIACAILAATGQLPAERTRTHGALGELALDGARAALPRNARRGTGGAGERRARARSLSRAGRAREAALVPGSGRRARHPAARAAAVLRGGPGDELPRPYSRRATPVRAGRADLSDVRGRHDAVARVDPRRSRGAQPAAERAARDGQDDARAAPALDSAAALTRGRRSRCCGYAASWGSPRNDCRRRALSAPPIIRSRRRA